MSDFHYFEPDKGHGLPRDPFKAIIGPRPIGWISSRSADGVLNLAPYSFFNLFASTPPIIAFSTIGWKHSIANIDATGEFGWSLATRPLADAMNATSAMVGADVDEFAMAGLETAPSRLISVPRVAASPASFECRLTQLFEMTDLNGDGIGTWMVFGQVVAAHIDKAYLTDGIFDTGRAQPILRAGGTASYVEIGPDNFFKIKRPG